MLPASTLGEGSHDQRPTECPSKLYEESLNQTSLTLSWLNNRYKDSSRCDSLQGSMSGGSDSLPQFNSRESHQVAGKMAFVQADSERGQQDQPECVKEDDHHSTVRSCCGKEQCQEAGTREEHDATCNGSHLASEQTLGLQNLGGCRDRKLSEQGDEWPYFGQSHESPKQPSLPEASPHGHDVGPIDRSLVVSDVGGARTIQQTDVASSPFCPSSSASQVQGGDSRVFAANQPMEHAAQRTIDHSLGRMEEVIGMESKDGQVEQTLLDLTFAKPLEMVMSSFEKPPASLKPDSTTDDTGLDTPGEYCIIHDETFLSRTVNVPTEEDVLGFLRAGSLVRVVEVVTNEFENRVRGKVHTPEGWISLLDTETGYRWAFRVKPTHSAEETLNSRPDTPRATMVVLPASDDKVGAVCRKPRAKAMCRRSQMCGGQKQADLLLSRRGSACPFSNESTQVRHLRAKSL
eukprot:TRINITY_DN64147_c0_g1_i1.p1 TRINITY_DN64147_c0_g1~~TRINITY_DN64147_c0_g1_i1.p1  ORF type:complete len:461 (+),score=45.85 TRINITY_DN64147_c0_g1_i1:64-1446(+)